jgi:hypothetical protein
MEAWEAEVFLQVESFAVAHLARYILVKKILITNKHLLSWYIIGV